MNEHMHDSSREPDTPSLMMPPATPVLKQGEATTSPESRTVPSTPNAATASSSPNARAGLGLLPKTPDRPTINADDSTPLLSPTYKRRSADFYALLKSPDHRISKQDSVKRRSLELYNVINKSPDRFVFHDKSGSPKRQIRVTKKNAAEIKELSETLKTKLNYAALKLQNGWGNKSLEELEQTQLLPHKPTFPRLDQVASRPRGSSNDEGFADFALYSALSRKNSSQNVDDDVAEKEAVISLMSLSSPVKKAAPPFPYPTPSPYTPHFPRTPRDSAIATDSDDDDTDVEQAKPEDDDAKTASDYSDA